MFSFHTGLAVGLGVSVASNARSSNTSPSPTPSPSPTNSTVCTTESCIQLAALVLSNMNQSVDPCEDFYNFSCGGWEATHRIPQGVGVLLPLLYYCQCLEEEEGKQAQAWCWCDGGLSTYMYIWRGGIAHMLVMASERWRWYNTLHIAVSLCECTRILVSNFVQHMVYRAAGFKVHVILCRIW